MHAFVPTHKFSGGVSSIHKVMLFTLPACDALISHSDAPMCSDLLKSPKGPEINLQHSYAQNWSKPWSHCSNLG